MLVYWYCYMYTYTIVYTYSEVESILLHQIPVIRVWLQTLQRHWVIMFTQAYVYIYFLVVA